MVNGPGESVIPGGVVELDGKGPVLQEAADPKALVVVPSAPAQLVQGLSDAREPAAPQLSGKDDHLNQLEPTVDAPPLIAPPPESKKDAKHDAALDAPESVFEHVILEGLKDNLRGALATGKREAIASVVNTVVEMGMSRANELHALLNIGAGSYKPNALKHLSGVVMSLPGEPQGSLKSVWFAQIGDFRDESEQDELVEGMKDASLGVYRAGRALFQHETYESHVKQWKSLSEE